MANFKHLEQPTNGEQITIKDGVLQVPNQPIVPFIEGDGTGPDIWASAQRVLDAAVEKAYNGEKKIAWFEVYNGKRQLPQLKVGSSILTVPLGTV